MYKFLTTLTQNGGRSALTRNELGPHARTFFTSIATRTTQHEISNDPDEPIDIPNPFEKERQQCILCKHGITPNYKNVKLLSQFQSSYTGRIYGRHITGLCKQKQREIEVAIAKAQSCALMPDYHKDLDFLKDPKLFDPERPIRPHKY